MTLTLEQLQIMFLMVGGLWDSGWKPLVPVMGVYLGYDMYITLERYEELHTKTHAIEMARLALK